MSLYQQVRDLYEQACLAPESDYRVGFLHALEEVLEMIEEEL